MGISFVNYSSGSYSAAAPTDLQDGDMLLWQGAYGGTASARLPEAFTNIDIRTSGSTSWQRLAWRIACDDGSITHSCQEYCQQAILAAFRKTGGAWVKPSDSGMWGAQTHNASSYTTPEVTPLTVYDRVVAMFYQDAAAVVQTPPAGWTHVGKQTDVDMYYYDPGSTDPISATIQYTGSSYGVSGIVVLSVVPTPISEIMAGYNKRVKVIIASSDIRADLYDYPYLVNLTSSSGTGATDCTDIFDTIGSSYLKIAVTTGDGLTQVPVEVDRWDNTNGYARLWVKLPYVSCTEDTELFVYYDEAASDNTQYVGLPASTVGISVWESNYEHVWHLSNDPSGGADCIIDSTGTVDGTPQGTMLEEDLIEGNIPGSQAIDFDGSNDWIFFDNNDGAWNMQGDKWWSMECLIRPDDITTYNGMIQHLYYNSSTARAAFRISATGYLGTYMDGAVSAWDLADYTTGLLFTEEAWHYAACQYSGFYNTGVGWMRNENFLDDTWERVSDGVSTCGSAIDYGITIGGRGNAWYDCAIGEVRIASKIQPRSWFEATRAALFNSLGAYSMEDVSPPVPNIILDETMLTGDEWKIVKNNSKRTVAGTYMLRRGVWRAISSTEEE
jgi:hypothetical protein